MITNFPPYVSWSIKILVTYVIEPMKWSKNKQSAGYIFARCIGLIPRFLLLAGFAVQSLLLAVLLCQLESMEGEFLGIWLCLELAQDPMHIFGYARLRGQLILLDIVFMLFLLGYCTPMNTCLVRQHIQCVNIYQGVHGVFHGIKLALNIPTPHSEVPLGNKHKSFRPCPHPFLYFSGT